VRKTRLRINQEKCHGPTYKSMLNIIIWRELSRRCAALKMNVEKWFIRSRARAVPRVHFQPQRALIRDRRGCRLRLQRKRERERDRERDCSTSSVCFRAFRRARLLLSGLRSSEGGHFPHPATDVRGLKPVFFADLLQQLRPPSLSVTFRLCLVSLYDARSQLASWTSIHS